MKDVRSMSAADLDGLNERARAARDQPEPEQTRGANLHDVPEPEPVAGEQMELLL